MKVTINEKQQPTLPLGVTPEELARWKYDFDEVFFIRIKDGGKKEIGAWMRLPSFDIVKLIQDTAKTHGELDAMEQLYINCKLKASTEIEKNFKYKLSLFSQMEALIKSYEAEVVKY